MDTVHILKIQEELARRVAKCCEVGWRTSWFGRGTRGSGQRWRVKHQGETFGKPLTRLACAPRGAFCAWCISTYRRPKGGKLIPLAWRRSNL